MNNLTVDNATCTHCGVCVKDCPMGIIGFENTTPVLPVEKEASCISCGHCVAVCPVGALSIGTTKPENCQTFDRTMLPSMKQMDHTIRSRRSVRAYKKNPVARETIKALIDTARYAPTTGNSQLVRWKVIDTASEIHRLGGLVIDYLSHLIAAGDQSARAYRFDTIIKEWEQGHDVIFRGAPAIVIASAPESHGAAVIDCSIALSYLDISAYSAELGTCWAGFFMMAYRQWEPLRKAVGLPDGESCYGALMIGHPAYDYHRIPPRKESAVTWM
jgi:nitroreductase/NAD-dependent dihydropyrimidine dehydrogenase PreA subunit